MLVFLNKTLLNKTHSNYLERYYIIDVLAAHWALSVTVEDDLCTARAQTDMLTWPGYGVLGILKADHTLGTISFVCPVGHYTVGLSQLKH